MYVGTRAYAAWVIRTKNWAKLRCSCPYDARRSWMTHIIWCVALKLSSYFSVIRTLRSSVPTCNKVACQDCRKVLQGWGMKFSKRPLNNQDQVESRCNSSFFLLFTSPHNVFQKCRDFSGAHGNEVMGRGWLWYLVAYAPIFTKTTNLKGHFRSSRFRGLIWKWTTSDWQQITCWIQSLL